MRTPITRRTALRSLAGAAAFATAARASAATAGPASAPAAGSLRQSVCKWCFPKIPLDEFCAQAKGMGLESVELLAPEDFATLKKHGLFCAMVSNPTGKTPQGVTVGAIRKAFNRVEHHDTLVEIYEKRIGEVAAAGFENLICFSGDREGMSDEQGLENCARGLKRLVATAEKHKVTLVMELLNSKVNHKDYMCDKTAWGVEVMKAVNSPNVKLLYDIYHMQIMEGDVIRTIRENHQWIGHYHTGGNPGRNEIDETQELNYLAISKAIADLDYNGYMAHEFVPKRDPLVSLKQAVDLCRV